MYVEMRLDFRRFLMANRIRSENSIHNPRGCHTRLSIRIDQSSCVSKRNRFIPSLLDLSRRQPVRAGETVGDGPSTCQTYHCNLYAVRDNSMYVYVYYDMGLKCT